MAKQEPRNIRRDSASCKGESKCTANACQGNYHIHVVQGENTKIQSGETKSLVILPFLRKCHLEPFMMFPSSSFLTDRNLCALLYLLLPPFLPSFPCSPFHLSLFENDLIIHTSWQCFTNVL